MKNPTLKISENQIKRDIMQILALRKIPAFRMNSGATPYIENGKRRFVKFGFPGCPDIVVLLSDRVGWIEVKTAKGKLSEAQKEFEALCRARMIPHLVARSTYDVEEWLDAYNKNTALIGRG
ncbi:MAG: VRR-NUC domain-containing protein [Waddliaceae bacterium]